MAEEKMCPFMQKPCIQRRCMLWRETMIWYSHKEPGMGSGTAGTMIGYCGAATAPNQPLLPTEG